MEKPERLELHEKTCHSHHRWSGPSKHGHAGYALTHPDRMRVIGVADPDPERCRMVREKFDLPDSMLFESAAALAERGKLADAVINGTMDQQHVETAVPLLAAGYDMLLEKPFALNEDELRTLTDTVRRYGGVYGTAHLVQPTFHP